MGSGVWAGLLGLLFREEGFCLLFTKPKWANFNEEGHGEVFTAEFGLRKNSLLQVWTFFTAGFWAAEMVRF